MTYRKPGDHEMNYDEANETATFTPQYVDGADKETMSRPCLTVAGVQVYAYVREDGTLQVSLDFDTADSDVFGEDPDGYARNVPVQVTLSGQTVYAIDRNGVDYFADDAEAFAIVNDPA